MRKYLNRQFKRLLINRHIIYASYEKNIMTIKWSNGDIDKYKGASNVWYKYPYMKECSTSMGNLLSELFEYHQIWDGAYPNAHNKHFE